MTFVEIAIAILSNVALSVVILLQHRRHMKYRDAIHALLQDGGHADGEAEMIVDEMLRMVSHLKMKPPTLQEFGHGLVKQKAFRRAVAHAELHDLYIQTHGRKA
ncbi:MAG: hypothetical protein ACREO4_09310 [Lysobacter sp.]